MTASGKPVDPQSMWAHRHRVRAIVHRDFLTALSYQFQFVLGVIQSLFVAVSFYFVDRFVGRPQSLGNLDGGYFEFVLLGVVVVAFVNLGVATFTAAIATEQSVGTLEMVLATPTPLPIVLIGGIAVSTFFTIIEVALLLVVGVLFLGASIPLGSLALTLPIMVLAATSFAPLGIVAAGLVVLAKRGDPVSGPARQIVNLVSGTLYPVSVLPGALQAFAAILPPTYAIRAVREITLGDASVGDIAPELAVLVGSTIVGIPIAVWIFGKAVAIARESGTLSNY